MMRMVCVAAASGALLFAAGGARAQAAEGVELGLQVYNYDYDETFDEGSVSDEGRFVGFTADYGRRFGAWSFDARWRFARGDVDYSASDGSRLDGVTQASGQLELLLGRPIASSPDLTVTPYVGIGGRVLLDESGGLTTNTGLEGYDREISYSYVPIGVAGRWSRPNGGSFVMHAQYNWIVGGESRSDFSDQGGPELKLEFEEGHGLEVGATMFTPVGRGRVGIGPFFRRWSLEDSKSVIFEEDGEVFEVLEPSNTTVEVGLKLTYGF